MSPITAARKIRECLPPVGDWFAVFGDSSDKSGAYLTRVVLWAVLEPETPEVIASAKPDGRAVPVPGLNVLGFIDSTGTLRYSKGAGDDPTFVRGDDRGPAGKTWSKLYRSGPQDGTEVDISGVFEGNQRGK